MQSQKPIRANWKSRCTPNSAGRKLKGRRDACQDIRHTGKTRHSCQTCSFGGDRPVCLREPGLLPDRWGRNAELPWQLRHTRRFSSSFIGRLVRRANTPGAAWRAIRLPVCQRHPLGLQESADAICNVEPLPRHRRHRFWRAGRVRRMVLPRDRTDARRRQSRAGSRARDRAQRTGECEHDSPRFVVDREAMAGRSYRCTCGTVCGPGFLWKRAIRRVIHQRANGLCVGQFVYDLRDRQSIRDAGRGNSDRTDRQYLSEIDGDGWRSVASYEQPNRPGSDVPRESSCCFGDWVHSGSERNIGHR